MGIKARGRYGRTRGTDSPSGPSSCVHRRNKDTIKTREKQTARERERKHGESRSIYPTVPIFLLFSLSLIVSPQLLPSSSRGLVLHMSLSFRRPLFLSFSLSHFIYCRLPFVLLTLFLRSRAREEPGYSPTHARDDGDDDAGNAGCCNMQAPNGRCFARAAL